MQNQNIHKHNRLVLGYYAFRGKMQVCRLLCEYLGVPYTDVLFTPKTWEEFKSTQKLNWSYPELPFLKDNEIVVTEIYPIITYIVCKSKREDFMGRTPSDVVKIDMVLWEYELQDQLLYLLVSQKELTKESKGEELKRFLQIEIMNKLAKAEEEAQENYFFGYISVLDFFIYECIHFMKSYSVDNSLTDLTVLPKLQSIFRTIAEIPQIKGYENSSKALKIGSPTQFIEEWKMRCCPQK